MRVLFLVLLIAVLPLRLWAGEAVAVNMASQHEVAVQSPCPDHHAASMGDSTSPSDPSDNAVHNHCGTIGGCNICHTAVATTAFNTLPPVALPRGMAPSDEVPFASATAEPSLKPPIC